MSSPARLIALLIVLAAAGPARAGFITYAFTSDSSELGGSLSGSFRVDELDLLDSLLTRTEVQNYQFTFTDFLGGATLYTLADLLPEELAVDSITGIPIGPIGFVQGEQVGGDGLAQADLTADALTPDTSNWLARIPSGAVDTGRGHWTIEPEGANPVPAPAGIVLGFAGAVCMAIGRGIRRLPA
jgi:hypothetical protein